MSEYRPRRDTRARGASNRRPARRTGGRNLAIAAVVVVLIVAFLIARTGIGRLFEQATPTNSPSTTASVSAKGAPASASAKPTAGKTQNAATTPAPSSPGSLGQAAWQTADPSWMARYKGELVDGFKPDPGYKAIALTFDDGPNYRTAYIIKTLGQYGGRGTFFDTGRNLAKPEYQTQMQLIWGAGFEVGNHTQHHTINNVSSMWHRSYATDLAEIQGPDVFVKAGTGRNTAWLRPMGGEIDATGMKAAADTNHLVINWTIDSNDSHGGPRTPDYIYNEVVSHAHSGDVVLLHVTHPESMAALPRICRTLTQQGYKLVTVSELAQHSTAALAQKVPQ